MKQIEILFHLKTMLDEEWDEAWILTAVNGIFLLSFELTRYDQIDYIKGYERVENIFRLVDSFRYIIIPL